MTPKQERYKKAGSAVVKSLKERHFEAYYAETKEMALKLVLSLIPDSDTVSWGGSLTLDETGILDAVKKSGRKLIDRDTAANSVERYELQRKALLSDTFLLSANAITEDGIIVNMDGNGNRAAAMVFGPKSVIVVAGMNKVVKTVEDAVSRVRTVAAPINAQRFPIKTPCKSTGICANCKSPDSICANMVFTRISRPAGKIKVILIGEDLGM